MFTKLWTEWKVKVLAKDLKSILFPRGLLMEYSSLKGMKLEYVSPALVGEYGSYFPPGGGWWGWHFSAGPKVLRFEEIFIFSF